MTLSVRDAVLGDCNALGLVAVTSSWKTFLGVIPEEDFDFSWTPAVSATNWRSFFTEPWPAQRFFFVAEVAGRVVGYAWGDPTGRSDYAHYVNAKVSDSQYHRTAMVEARPDLQHQCLCACARTQAYRLVSPGDT